MKRDTGKIACGGKRRMQALDIQQDKEMLRGLAKTRFRAPDDWGGAPESCLFFQASITGLPWLYLRPCQVHLLGMPAGLGSGLNRHTHHASPTTTTTTGPSVYSSHSQPE